MGILMMNDVLTVTMLRKGDCAAKVLASEGWPKPLFQKLIDMRYNKAYKATSKDPASKLPMPAPLSWPIATPAEYKALKDKTAKLFKAMLALQKQRIELERDIAEIEKIPDSKIEAFGQRMEALAQKYHKYKNNEEKLYDDCVELPEICKDAKIAMRMSKKRMRETAKEMQRVERRFKKEFSGKHGLLGKDFAKDLKSLKDKLKLLKADQEAMAKELANAVKLVAKLAMVMP
jgi:hypothetical protein